MFSLVQTFVASTGIVLEGRHDNAMHRGCQPQKIDRVVGVKGWFFVDFAGALDDGNDKRVQPRRRRPTPNLNYARFRPSCPLVRTLLNCAHCSDSLAAAAD